MGALDARRRPAVCGRLGFLSRAGILVIGLASSVVLPVPAAAGRALARSAVGAESTLNGVSCVSTSSCIAVGYVGGRTLVESWNGSGVVGRTQPCPGDEQHTGRRVLRLRHLV